MLLYWNPICHLCSVIHKNLCIPKYPLVAQELATIQFQNKKCPILEDKDQCQEVSLSIQNCTVQLLKENERRNCQALEVYKAKPISEQVTQNTVMVILEKLGRIFSKCNTDRCIEISVPSLLKLRKNMWTEHWW